MSDKDPLVVISEMLRKQDQQAEKLGEHSTILNHHTKILDQHTGLIMETNETLKQFVEISIQEFDQQRQQYQLQQQFNERFLDRLDKLNENFSNNQNQQNHFNERFINKLEDIEKALKK
jgi:hypothetical protein